LAEPISIGLTASKKEFMVKMSYVKEKELKESYKTYTALDGGIIQYEFKPGHRNKEIDFSWGALFEIQNYQ